MNPPPEMLQYGVLGILCFILLGWIYYKDKQGITDLKEMREAHKAEVKALTQSLRDEQTARIDDAKAFNTLALDLQQQAIAAVTEIRGIVEEYGNIGGVVSDLVAVLQRRNGHE
jgi:hypothetical protein